MNANLIKKLAALLTVSGLLHTLTVNVPAQNYSTPNNSGGMNYYQNGQLAGRSTSNVFGGKNLTTSNGRTITTTPNVFGGQNYRGNK
jgi:hypothetical protein